MFTIIKKSIKDKYKALLIYVVVNLVMIVLYVAIYPSLMTQLDSLKSLLDTMPQEFLKAFNSDFSSLSTLEGILSGKHFGMLWPILTVVLTTNFAAFSIASEVDNKTFSILLSQPISRKKIFWSKYFSGLIYLFIYIIFTIPITILIVKLFNVSVNEIFFMKFSLEAFLFGFCFLSIAFMLSAISKDTTPVNFIGIGLIIGMYFLQVLSKLLKDLDFLKYFSAFYYFDSERSLVRGNLMLDGLFLFIIIGIVSTLIGYRIFIKRDIAV